MVLLRHVTNIQSRVQNHSAIQVPKLKPLLLTQALSHFTDLRRLCDTWFHQWGYV